MLHAALTAAVGTSLAVAVNVATGSGVGTWAWVGVAGLTVVSCLLSLWLRRVEPGPTPPVVALSRQQIVGSAIGGSVNQIGAVRGNVVIRRPGP
ncbi:hypothetical protein ACVGOW_13065 [Pseudonocardia saturnea]